MLTHTPDAPYTDGWKSRGILYPQAGALRFHLKRYPPSPDLATLVDRYWLIDWDLTGQPPYCQETLPYPCVNLVFEQDFTWIYGVETGKSARLLEGKGQVAGIKFKPGGFYPFLGSSMTMLTDRILPLEEVFTGIDAHAVEAEVLNQSDHAGMVAAIEDFLRAYMPPCDTNLSLIDRVIDTIIHQPTLTRVETLAEQFGFSQRSLQRLFSRYVGVSPKWTIQRYRLQEAAELLATHPTLTPDWSMLALELGFFDQAHFIKAFKALIGSTPADYARQLRQNNADGDPVRNRRPYLLQS